MRDRGPLQLANIGVLRYLAQGGDPAEVTVEQPGPDTDTWRLGAHPDVVERLWTDLNAALPADSRFLVAGGAALVHPESDVIIALALGTKYALRLTGDASAEAEAAGFDTVHEFHTVGRTLDVAAVFGPGWIFGQFDARELDWLPRSVRAMSDT
jgi:hypothetical protein